MRNVFRLSIVMLCAALLLSCAREETGIKTIELKDHWLFSQVGTEQWYEASVPGCVHTDLLNNGLINAPFYRDNEDSLQWIENESWRYKTSFDADPKLLARENIRLIFEGLDTYADVYMNGTLLLSADNMFRVWEADCKHLLEPGTNTIFVQFHPPAGEITKKAQSVSYDLPEKRAYARKAPYQFGWDWGPRFVTSGIWRPVRVEAWDQARFDNVQIIRHRITEELAELSAIFEIESSRSQEAVIQLDLQDSKITGSNPVLLPGKNSIRVDFSIPDPELWWTRGLGEAFLYELTARLVVDGDVVDEIEDRVGLRTVEIVQDPDSAGSSFYVRLNGVPVFMKGANYVPQDNFLNRVTSERYEALIRSAVDANMNMLRVWGGGIYEEDIFYDLCDENGLLVWQDFMFAGTMYPGDSTFVENVRHEAIDNVVRLRNHPCIALWCGNNEVDNGWKDWGWQKQFGYSTNDSVEIWNNYKKVFHELLPGIVQEYDPTRFYWPSSPLYGWGHEENFREGDSHYWGVWWGGEPLDVFDKAVGRFMSEYGFQSLPDFRTIESFTSEGDRELESDVMRAHQKFRAGNERIAAYMKKHYVVPEDFGSFVYVSQLLQAAGIKRAIEAHRRARPYCMGTLYWQLNDCWPATSWSSRDYYGRWKALHYFVKKAFNDVLVSVTGENGAIGVYCISDKRSTLAAKLSIDLVSFGGDTLFEKETAIQLPPNSSDLYFEMEKDRDLKNVVLVAKIEADGQELSKTLYYFAPVKNLDLPEPGITQTVTRMDDGYRITLTSEHLAKNVFLSCDTDGFFSDNYFDMLPGLTVTVDFTPAVGGADRDTEIRVRSLVDIYR